MDARLTRERILSGNIFQNILRLSAPLIFSQLVQIIYNLVDTFWLGRLGRVAVAAPSVTWPILFTIIMFGGGIATAGLALVSQYVGANRWEDVDRVVGNLLVVVGILAVVFGVLGYFLAAQLLHLLNTPPTVFPYAKEYLQVLFLSLPFTFVVFVFSMVLRAVGDMWTPTKINLATILVNVVLDPIFIFGYGVPRMGVVGAALATAISNALASLAALIVLVKGWKHITVRREHLAPERRIVSKLLRIGLPVGISNSINGVAFAVIMSLVASFGAVAVAAYGIGMRVINVVSAVARGLSQASAVMIGQNIGAEQYDRARRVLITTVKMTFSTMALLSVAVFTFRHQIVSFFISDPAVVRTGATMLYYFALSVPFFGIFFPVLNALRAAGKTKISAALSFIRIWVFRVGLASLFGSMWGSVAGVFFGMALSNVLGGALSSIFLVWDGWIRRVID